MAKERCSYCGGSGWFDQGHGKKCQRCYGTGMVDVPNKPTYGRPGETCFAGSTLILTPDGWQPILDLRRGSQVVSYDRLTGKTSVRQVKQVKDHKPEIIWEIHFTQTKRPICTTKSHSFLTNRGWRTTRQLRSGDVMTTVGGREAVVASVIATSRAEPVFNLLTGVEHTFVAEGCVVHNFTYFRNLRVWWHKYILSAEPAGSQNYAEAFN
jgi:Pretoxin HINT domain